MGIDGGKELTCPPRLNCVCSLTADTRQQVAPFAYEGAPGEALRLLTEIIESMRGGAVDRSTACALHATFTSRFLRFIDDLDFQVRDDVLIDVRSMSRVGYYDFGVNRARVEAIRDRFLAMAACRNVEKPRSP